MNKLRFFTGDALPKSLIPLIFYGVLSIIRTQLQTKSLHNPNLSEDLQRDIVIRNEDLLYSGSEESSLHLLDFLQETIIGSYHSVTGFLTMMFLVNVLVNMFNSQFPKGKEHQLQEETNSEDSKEQIAKDMFKVFGKSRGRVVHLCKTIFFYTLMFCIYQTLAVWVGFVSTNYLQVTSTQDTAFPDQTSFFNEDRKMNQETLFTFDNDFELHNDRMLTAVNPSIGQVVGSISCNAYSIIMSRDEKTAFISQTTGSLQIVNVTNIEAPTILANLTLFESKTKMIILSHDEKTLFASDFLSLEVINITNLLSPQVTISLMNPDHITKYYHPSLALSADGKILFAAGYGFNIFDISDLTSPSLISSYRGSFMTTLAMSKDRKHLFLANSTLQIFDLTNPRSPSLITSFGTRGSFYSLYVPGDEKTVFGIGIEDIDIMVFEVLDITNLTKPVSRHSSVIASTVLFAPNILIYVPPTKDKLYFRTPISSKSLLVKEYPGFAADPSAPKVLERVTSFVFSADGNRIFAVTNFQFFIFQIFSGIRNSRILDSQTNNLFRISIQVGQSFGISPDEKILVMPDQDPSAPILFKVYNISDLKSPGLIKTVESTFQDKANYVGFFTTKPILHVSSSNKITLYDFTDPSNPTVITTWSTSRIHEPKISKDDKTGFFPMSYPNREFTLEIWDVSDHNSPKVMSSIKLGEKENWSFTTFQLSKNANTLFLAREFLTIYDVSNRAAPEKLCYLPLYLGELSMSSTTFALSSDDKILFAMVREYNFEYLKIFDISNLRSPVFISKLMLPDKDHEEQLQISPDDQLLYIANDNQRRGGFIVIDVSNLRSPKIMGLNKLKGQNYIQQMQLSKSGELMYYISLVGGMNAISLNPKYTLYFPTDKFGVGNKYSTSLLVFRQDEQRKYVSMNETYKIVQVSLYDTEVSPAEFGLIEGFYPLPSWMHFDKENNILNVEPKAGSNIGRYELRGVISTEVTEENFQEIELFKNETEAKDLMSCLISTGYLDMEGFLTAAFDPEPKRELRFPSKYWNIREELIRILAKSYLQTITQVQVVPSLSMQKKQGAILITTPNTNLLSVAVQLNNVSSSAVAQFVAKPYSSVQGAITDKKSKLILEGGLAEMNKALKEVAVDFSQSNETYNGTITISDGRNPTTTFALENLTEYFRVNKAPMENENYKVQSQINLVPLFTGDYFSIEFNAKTFLDSNDANLEYLLEMPGNSKENPLPVWLTLKGLVLAGTPPEKWTSLKTELVLVAKNEFKEKRVPIELNVKISFIFALKTLFTYGGYIFTALGIWYSLHKIYNIIGKRNYRSPKPYIVAAGREITARVIPPIGLISNEIKESKLLITKIEKLIAERMNLKVYDVVQLANYFVDESTDRLNPAAIVQTVETVISALPAHEKKDFLLYYPGVNSRAAVINQLVIDEMVWRRLGMKQEKATLDIFNRMKETWHEIVETSKAGKYYVNQSRFLEELDALNLNPAHVKFSDDFTEAMSPSAKSKYKNLKNPLEESLLGRSLTSLSSSGILGDSTHRNIPLESKIMNLSSVYNENRVQEGHVNYSLLEQALLAHAFKFYNLNADPIKVQIMVKQKFDKVFRLRKLYEFFLLHLDSLPLNEKGSVGYGLLYKVEDNTLFFYGVPHRNIQYKKVVVQIISKSGRILRELEILGTVQEQDDANVVLIDEKEVL